MIFSSTRENSKTWIVRLSLGTLNNPNSHGYPIPVLERRRFLEILYENTPDKSKIRSGTAVVDVIDHDKGVKVILADGSVEDGDLVLGCDGVHSNVRNMMWRNANAAVPGMITTAEKKCKLFIHTSSSLKAPILTCILSFDLQLDSSRRLQSYDTRNE